MTYGDQLRTPPCGVDPARPPEAGQVRAVRAVVVVLFVNLGLSVAFAALTLLFRTEVVDHQLALDPAQVRDELDVSLWIRALIVVSVAIGYSWVARRLRQGSRSAYLRIRAISLIGFIAISYLILSAAYPGWLRVVQGVQLLGLGALIAVTNRRLVRDAFPRETNAGPRPGNLRAALLLVVVTPVIADFSLGTVPVAMAWLMLLFVPIYGAGVLLIRELVRRTGGGWGSLALLGVAYGLLEEGLALQSLTSPHLYHAAEWAPRVFGVNSAYTELNLPHHVIFSVLVPIALVELVFPVHGTLPYLRTRGVVLAGVVTLLGAAVLRLSVPPSEDPGYVVPWPAAAVFVALIAVLTVLALGVLPRRTSRGPVPLAPPSPLVVGLVCGLTVFGFVALLFPFGGSPQPSFTHGMWVLIPMVAAAALAAGTGRRLARWVAAPEWSDRHLLAAIGAAVIAHTVFGIVAQADTVLDRAVLGALVVGVSVLLARSDARLRAAEPPTQLPAPR